MFTLPPLPFAPESLEPHIDTATTTIHHTKHHQAYVDNLNKLLPDKTEADLPNILANIDSLPEGIRQGVKNHGGGHANHSLFWTLLSPIPSTPSPSFLSSINSTFGSLDKFKEDFTAKAMSVFGSGWAFLIKKPDGTLALKRHSFQNSPLMQGNIPLLALDVWEHAYYLKFQNRRAEYITAWWNVVNWAEVSRLFEN